MWLEFSRFLELTKKLNRNPRSAARAFLHNSLVDGNILDPPASGPAMAASIAWLITSHDVMGPVADQHHMLGYDIAYVPGPPGQARMFNFRAIIHPEYDKDLPLEIARALPLPPWRPPPH